MQHRFSHITVNEAKIAAARDCHSRHTAFSITGTTIITTR